MTEIGEIRRALYAVQQEQPNLHHAHYTCVRMQEVVRAVEDRIEHVWWILELNEDEEWVVRSEDARTWTEARDAHDRLLWHRIEREQRDREARKQTLADAQAAHPPDQLQELLELGLAMLADGFDWEAHAARCREQRGLPETVEQVWKAVTGPVVDDSRWGWPAPLSRCGQTKLSGNHRRLRGAPGAILPVLAFYRMIYRIRPKKLDLSDLYHTTVCGIVSADLRFAVLLDLFKYEPVLRFYCHHSVIIDEQDGQAVRLESDLPGVALGVSCTDVVGRLWFAFVTAIAQTPTMIYAGNEFEV